MLKTLFSLVMVVTLFVGCSQQNNPVSGTTSNDIRFVSMPPVESLQKMLFASASITEERGGRLKIKYSERDSVSNGKLKLEFELTFLPHSVTNDFVVTANMDATYLMTSVDVELGPNGTGLVRPAELNMEVSGVDLSWLDPNDKLYLFYNNNGNWERMAGEIKFDIRKQKVECSNGMIPHFSQYAFGRVTEE